MESFIDTDPQRRINFPEDQMNKLESFLQVDIDKVQTIVHRVKLGQCNSDPLLVLDVMKSNNFYKVLNIISSTVNGSIVNTVFPAS